MKLWSPERPEAKVYRPTLLGKVVESVITGAVFIWTGFWIWALAAVL